MSAEETEGVEPIQRPSTKRPTAKKRKQESVKPKEDVALDEAMGTLQTVKEKLNTFDEDDAYGKTIAFEMRKIKDQRRKAYAKLKIQEIIYNAQVGQTEGSMNYGTNMSSMMMSPPFVQAQKSSHYPLSPLAALQATRLNPSSSQVPSPSSETSTEYYNY